MNLFERLAIVPDILRRLGDHEKELAAYGKQVTLLSDGLADLRKLVDQIDDRLYQLSLRTGIVEDLLHGVRQPVTDKLDGVRQPVTDKPVVSEIAQGNTLQNLRKSTGLTQAELASRLGVNSRTVRRWEGSEDLSRRTRIAYEQVCHADNTVATNEPMQAKHQPALPDKPARTTTYNKQQRLVARDHHELYAKLGFDRIREFTDISSTEYWGCFVCVSKSNNHKGKPWRFVLLPSLLRLRNGRGRVITKCFSTRKEADLFAYKFLCLHEAECLKRGLPIDWWFRVNLLHTIEEKLDLHKEYVRGVINE